MEKHTEGKLQVEIVGDTGGENPVHVCEIGNDHVRVGEYITEANARRLVACWNACEGLDTETLESGRVTMVDATDNYVAERDALLRDKAELLEILQSIELAMNMPKIVSEGVLDENSPIRDAIRDALAKHGGAK